MKLSLQTRTSAARSPRAVRTGVATLAGLALTAMAVAGCGSNGSDGKSADSGNSGSAALPTGAVAELANRVPANLRNQGYWNVAGPLNAPPVGYVDKSGKLVGSEIEIVQAI